jgi:transposase
VGDQWWSRRGGPSIGRGAPLNAELTLIIHEYEDDRVGSLHDLEWLIRSSSVVARSKQQQLVADRRRELIEPLIPQRPARRGPGGRPRIDDLAALEGILSCSTPVVAGGIFPRSWAADPGTPRWRQADLVLPPEAAELSSAVAELRRRTNAQELDVLRNLPESRCRDWHPGTYRHHPQWSAAELLPEGTFREEAARIAASSATRATRTSTSTTVSTASDQRLRDRATSRSRWLPAQHDRPLSPFLLPICCSPAC